MPAPELEAIRTERLRLREAETRLKEARSKVMVTHRKLEEGQRRGMGQAQVVALEQALEQAKASEKRRKDAILGVAEQLDALLAPAARTPEAQLATQSRNFPVALLPVRIETRSHEGDLLLRIYPDQLHLHAHEDAIGKAEAERARDYWTLATAEPDKEAEAWTLLARTVGPERARYLANALQPDSSGAFPAIETVETPLPAKPEARLLPTRWCATLLDDKGNILARHWSKPVARRLAMSPAGDLLDALADAPEGTLPIDPEASWMVDFEEAVDKGMAIRLKPADFATGALPNHVARLIVVGSDWTRAPGDAAEALTDQLVAHSHGQGFGLLAPGTPTNQGGEDRPGGGIGLEQRIAQSRPAAATPPLAPDQDLARLIDALGLPDAATALAGAPGSDRVYEQTVRPLHSALWGTCFGFYLGQVLNPLFPEGRLAATRAHLRDHVRPAGPCPTMRVGRQPYALLPVLATPVRTRKIDAMTGYTGELARLLGRIRTLAEGFDREGDRVLALDAITTLHDGDGASADRLAEILKMGPLARTARVRPTLGAAARETASQSTQRLEARHRDLVRLLLSSVTGGRVVNPWDAPLIFDLVVPGRPRYRLDAIPWVAANLDAPDALAGTFAKVRERIAAAAANPNQTARLLAVAADDAGTLFEGLLFLAGAYEYWEAGTKLIAEHIVIKPQSKLAASPIAASARLATADLTGIERAAAPEGQIAVETVGQMMKLGGTATGGRSLLARINELAMGPDILAVPESVRDVKGFDLALSALADRPAREVDHALRGMLDLGSHRLDAWITSVATRRLAEQRDANKQGVHVGCYGIVHDLRLGGSAARSQGYVHVPSPDHAVTAAVLRAGNLANQASHEDAFAIRLTSQRVREALAISEGIAAGQPASALLGYRFERWLVDDRHAAKYIGPLRRLKPHPVDAAASAISEGIPVHDVVDGLALALAWKKDKDALRLALAPLVGGAIDPPIDPFLDDLIDLHDAFADLWTAEATHQMLQGNVARSAAALATVDRQETPPDARVVNTPRAAWTYGQRVLWALPADAKAPADWPKDVVSRAEPVANAIAAALLGKPDRYRLEGEPLDEQGAPSGPPVRLKLVDLDLSPLALLRAARGSGGETTSPLDHLILGRLRAEADLGPGERMRLRPNASAGRLGAGQLLARLRTIRPVIFGRPALRAQGLAPPTGIVDEGAVPEVLEDRVGALAAWADEHINRLDQATGAAEPKPARLRAACLAAAALAPASPALLEGADLPLEALLAESRAMAATLTGWKQRLAAPADPATHAADDHLARLQLILGPDFPVLPPFTPPAALAAEWRATLADQAALTGTLGGRAITRWRRAMSLVRTNLRALSAGLDALRAAGEPSPALRIAQLPHLPGRAWASLEFKGEPPREVQLSAALIGDVPEGKSIAGLLIDEWTEAVPERQTATGLSFHYDAPAARPPQSILLAVDAGLEAGGWTVDALVATVIEGFDLARLRMLRPSEIAGQGALLPTTFLPRNLSGEMLSLDLLGLAIKAEQIGSMSVLGKADR